jgi:hypothetical protein
MLAFPSQQPAWTWLARGLSETLSEPHLREAHEERYLCRILVLDA